MELPSERPLGKYERLAYERHERDLETGHERGLWFDAEAADHVVQFFERFCRHFEGEWAGELIRLSPEEKFILRSVFGWKRADGTRRFRKALVEVARKAGKTFLGGGVGLYLTGPDQEPGAQAFSAATKQDQARKVHDAAKAMVEQSPELGEFFQVLRSVIICPVTRGTFRPLGADSKTEDGHNVHGAIIDELHAHKDRRVWMKLQTGRGARRQPLMFIITTAGVYDPTSIGWEIHEDATKVLEGVYEDDSFFVFIAAADEGDDWTDPATWWKANPHLGISVHLDIIAEDCEQAKRMPSFEAEFRQMYCNEWVNATRRWLSMDAWKRCGGVIDSSEIEGQPCWGGLDLSSKLDLTAFVLVFPGQDKRVRLFCRFWLPEDVVTESALTGRVPYHLWTKQGWIQTTPGNVIDYDFIRDDINELAERFSIQEIGFDPHDATQITLQLAKDGFTMAEMRQGHKTLSEPTKEFEALVVSGRLRHGDNPVLRWMASNVVTRRDANANIVVDKDKSTQRIDGIAAAIMGYGRAILQQQKKISIYKTRGVTVIDLNRRRDEGAASEVQKDTEQG